MSNKIRFNTLNNKNSLGQAASCLTLAMASDSEVTEKEIEVLKVAIDNLAGFYDYEDSEVISHQVQTAIDTTLDAIDFEEGSSPEQMITLTKLAAKNITDRTLGALIIAMSTAITGEDELAMEEQVVLDFFKTFWDISSKELIKAESLIPEITNIMLLQMAALKR